MSVEHSHEKKREKSTSLFPKEAGEDIVGVHRNVLPPFFSSIGFHMSLYFPRPPPLTTCTVVLPGTVEV